MKLNRGLTLFLKVVILFIGAVVLALCIFVLVAGISSTTHWGDYRPILLGMYITVIPFSIALCQTLKLLGYIDQNKAFSDLSVKSLKYIKYCAIAISAMYATGMPYIFIVADRDDAPGVVLIGLVFTFASLVIAVFAAVLQKMLQNAIDIKSESDLTV